jgi:transcriptional regulator with XRE-family HTH domain
MHQGEELKQLISNKGLTFTHVAKKLKIDRISLYRILQKETINQNQLDNILNVITANENPLDLKAKFDDLQKRYKKLQAENRILTEKIKHCTETNTEQWLHKSNTKITE